MSKKSVLDTLTVKEVDRIIRSNKNLKEAAKELGVLAQELYLYRSKNMKEFNRLKSEREQGLVLEEEKPIIKTQSKSLDAKNIEKENETLKEDNARLLESSRAASEKLNEAREKIKKLEEEIVSKDLDIKTLQKDKDKALTELESTGLKYANGLKLQEKHYEDKIKKHQETIDKAGKTISIIRKNLENLEEKQTDTVSKYESLLEEERVKFINLTETIAKLKDAIYEKDNEIKSLESSIEGYQSEIENMTLKATAVPESTGDLMNELAFYKHHAMKYFKESNHAG